jgi:hypothetical protein
VRDDEANRAAARARLPEGGFDGLVRIIGQFIAFQQRSGVLTREAHASYVDILVVLDPEVLARPLILLISRPDAPPQGAQAVRNAAGGTEQPPADPPV